MLTLERSTPEETGIPGNCIVQLIKRLQKRHIPMHSLLLLHHDRLIFEGYYAPCSADRLHRMFSISKSFTAIAIGLLCDEGKISLDDPIIRYFPEKLPQNVHPWIAQMTIRDMLMMRSCHASTTYKLDLTSDWVESYFTTPPTHPPGTLFHYDTSAPHTLCALVEKLTGSDMLDYIKSKLHVLGLSPQSYMIKDPFGVSMGGSGLVAFPLDLVKFGYFIAHRGQILGESLLSSSYIDMVVSALTETCVTAPLPSEAQGYGMQFWRGEKNGFTCYGMGGQLIIFLPQYHLICVTTADTQSIQGGNQQIYDALYEELLPYIQDHALPPNETDLKRLQSVQASLHIAPLPECTMPHSLSRIDGKRYHVLTKSCDFQYFCLHFDKDAHSHAIGTLSFSYKERLYSISFGFGVMQTGNFPTYNLFYAASGTWLFDGTLYIKAHILDSYIGSVQFQLAFCEDELIVWMSKKEESLFQEFNGHLYCKSS